MLGFITSTQPARLAITLMTRKAITVLKRRFKSEVHHLKSLTEESSSVKVGY
jgi:hypothetical protein